MFKNFVKKQKESENAIKEFNAIDDIERPYDPELDTIEYLRSLDKKEYEKIIRKTEIYRDADEAVAKLDSKKVVNKTQELIEDEFVQQ